MKNYLYCLSFAAIFAVKFTSAVPLAGKYCIGPSFFYTAPSGGGYVNAFSPYPTLSAAIASLNANGASAHVIFELQNDYTSVSEVVPIDILYQGTTTTTVTIRPRTDLIGQLVFARPAAIVGTPGGLINFKGADHVKIDGSPGGINGTVNGLIVRNTSGSASALPTFNFMNEATNLTINAVQIEGRISCIRFDSTGTNGNDFLTISNCTLRERSDVASPAPTNLVVSSGSFALVNNDILFQNNNFMNWGVLAVNLGAGVTGNWTFDGNNFFLTGSFIAGGSRIISLSSTSNATNFVFSNNNIGGSAPGATGAKLRSVSACVQVVIPDNAYSYFNNNRFANMRISGPISGFYAINTSGVATITNNIIGDPLVADDIILDSTANPAVNAIQYGSNSNIDTVEISGNIISNITSKSISNTNIFRILNFADDDLVIRPAFITNNSIRDIYYAGRGAMNVIDIFAPQTPVANIYVFDNIMEDIIMAHDSSQAFVGINVFQSAWLKGNRIGSLTTPNSIVLNGFAHHKGINTSGINGRIIIEFDTISNIVSSNDFNSATQLTGISTSNANSAMISINDNLITNLITSSIRTSAISNASTGFATAGILFTASGNMLIEDNVISGIHAVTTAPVSSIVAGMINTSSNPSINANTVNNLTASATGVPSIAGLYNLKSSSGICHVFNNMIALSNGSNLNAVDIYGIYDQGDFVSAINAFHYNSVAISGNASGSSVSTCYSFNRLAPGSWLLNNLFNNTRQGGLKNYGIYNLNGNASHWLSTSSDYNNIYSSNPLTAARWSANDQTLAQWQISTGGDLHSISTPAVFVSEQNDLHLIPADPANCYFNGAAYDTSFTTSDFDHTGRSTTAADIGADEFNGIQVGLAIDLFIEGYYSSGSLSPALFVTGISTDPTDCDSVTVELHDAFAPYNLVFSKQCLLKTDGTISCTLPCAFGSGNYYLVVKGRNMIETWSKFPVALSENTYYTFVD